MTSTFPLTLPESIRVAEGVVRERFETVVGAWLGGSVPRGDASATSDLDVLVMRADGHPTYRESFERSVDGTAVPVELFVMTPTTGQEFRAKDQRRRQPTTARLVAEAVLLCSDDPAAARALHAECTAEIAVGPTEYTDAELKAARYALTDQVDDLAVADPGPMRSVIAAQVWESAARLLLGSERRWQGTGKGLLRELRHRDAVADDDLGHRLADGLVRAQEEPTYLEDAASDVLRLAGGAYRNGYRVG